MTNLEKLSEKLDCKNYGSYLAARCLFHDDSRPSLMVYEDYYNCLSCGAHGKTENLVKKFSNTMLLNVKTKPDFHNPWSRWLRNSTVENVCRQSLKLMTSQPSLGKYLIQRGITNPVHYCIGYRDDWYIFPITDSDGIIIGGVARANAETNNAQSKYIIPHKQDPDYLYIPDWKLLDTSSEVYLTFGIIDALSLAVLGKAAMSTTTGKRLNPSALDWLRKKIIIVPDQYEEQEAQQIANGLGWRGEVKKIDYPFGTKDFNDLVTHNLLNQFVF